MELVTDLEYFVGPGEFASLLVETHVYLIKHYGPEAQQVLAGNYISPSVFIDIVNQAMLADDRVETLHKLLDEVYSKARSNYRYDKALKDGLVVTLCNEPFFAFTILSMDPKTLCSWSTWAILKLVKLLVLWGEQYK